MKRHRVLCFFVLAYALAWGAIPWHSFFAPGALVSAIVVVSADRRPARSPPAWFSPHSLASELGVVRPRRRCAAAGPLHLVTANVALGAPAPSLTC